MSDVAPEPQEVPAQPEPTPEPQEAPTREEFEQLARAYMESQSRLMQAASYIESLNTRQEEEGGPELELEDDEGELDTDALQQLIAETVANTLTNQLEQHPAVASMTEQRGQQIANAQFDQIEKQIGSFDRSLAITVAQAAHSRGMDPHAAVQAGAQYAKQYADGLRQEAIQEYEQQLRNRLEAPTETSSTGAATVNRPKQRTYDDVNKDFFARRNAQQALN